MSIECAVYKCRNEAQFSCEYCGSAFCGKEGHHELGTDGNHHRVIPLNKLSEAELNDLKTYWD